MADKRLRIIYAFARSGGTLLNKCLGTAKGNVVLSEVNPAACTVPLDIQAVKWFRLLPEREGIELRDIPYAEQIETLREHCDRQGKKLIIRDWTTINFLPMVLPNLRPSGVLEQEIYMASHFYDTRRLVISRKAAAVYQSTRDCWHQYRNLSEDAFAEIYSRYVERVKDFPRVHLEEFVVRPHKIYAQACEFLECYCDPCFLERFANYNTCTGNNTLHTSRASKEASGLISPKYAEAEFRSTAARSLCAELDQLMGYE